jgi:hypothetical protein
MLVAHYDSVPRGPGASDDGHGVAVLLETLRALKSAAPLRNDVIFLSRTVRSAGCWAPLCSRAIIPGGASRAWC